MTNPLPGYAALLRPKGLPSNAKTDLDRWMQRNEVLALLAAARKGKEKWAADAYDAFVLMANLGLRVAEVPMLQISNFDSLLTHNAVNIASLKKAAAKKIPRATLMSMSPAQLQQMQQQMRAAADSRKKIPVLKTLYVGDKEKKVISTVVERRRKRAESHDGGMFYWGSRMLQYLFNYYRAAARLRVGLSCHSMRRFVATHISDSVARMKDVQPGDPERMASKRLRHSEKLIEHYVQLSPERQIALLAKVEPLA